RTKTCPGIIDLDALVVAATLLEWPGPRVTVPTVEPVIVPPNLERIIVPRAEHIDAAAQVRGLSKDQVRPGLTVALMSVQAMEATRVKGAKAMADARRAWLQATA